MVPWAGPWRQATRQDLVDYRHWRCRAQENPRRISGTKWNREPAAFTKLFRWAKVSPLPVDVVRRGDRAADSVSSRVLWLTLRTWGLWSDIGLRGHTRTGVPVPGRESRTELSTSFVQLLLSSGLRRQEGGSLLTFELPSQRLRFGRYGHGRVAAAVTRSKKSRVLYVSVDVVGQVQAYIESERAWAVQRAQSEGRYEQLPTMWLVTKVTRGLRPRVEWVDADISRTGRRRRHSIPRIDNVRAAPVRNARSVPAPHRHFLDCRAVQDPPVGGADE